MFLHSEIFMAVKWEMLLNGKLIKRAMYVLIIWEYLGTKLFWLLSWENFVSWDVFSGFHCNSALLLCVSLHSSDNLRNCM